VCAVVFFVVGEQKTYCDYKKPTQTSINVFHQGTKGMLKNHFIYHNPVHSFVVYSNGHLVESIRSVGHWRWGFVVRQAWVRSLLWVYGNVSSTLVHCTHREQLTILEQHNRQTYTYTTRIKWIFVSICFDLLPLDMVVCVVSSVNCMFG
jgi:hypothetical protein